MNAKSDTRAGQSLVLIALMIVVLLAFAGLAVDVGMLYARSSQFSSAVDAATLAGVVDLHEGVSAAHERADAFMGANGWPITGEEGDSSSDGASDTHPELGYPRFHFEVTYWVDTFFLRLLGFQSVPINHSASASIFSWADMPTATQSEQGLLRAAGQFITGPESCTAQGDPVSAAWRNNGVPNPFRTESGSTYTYRIRVPAGYTQDLVVQLFDPDTLNTRNGSMDADKDALYGSGPLCVDDIGKRCLLRTGDSTTGNPIWLKRLDEIWQHPSPPDPDDPDWVHRCPEYSPDNGATNDDLRTVTITRYELYYLDEDNNRQDYAVFQSGPATDALTDMRWVTPGVDGMPSELNPFIVDSADLQNMPTDQDGYQNVYMDVRTVQGMSKNGWDVWAGSPADANAGNNIAGNDVNGDGIVDGNERNLFILENIRDFSTSGIEIFATGYLPVFSYFTDQIPVPLVSIDQSLGGESLSLTVFDFERLYQGDPVPVQFRYSSVATPEDWPEINLHPMCGGGWNCNNAWSEPHFNLLIPSPETDPPVAFYGGYLMATYPGYHDDHVWHATLPLGRPFLTR